MLRSQIFASMLVALVSVPGFLVGQKLRHGDHTVALLLVPALLVVVFLAGMIMRQSDGAGSSASNSRES
jgi:hypothetical protein